VTVVEEGEGVAGEPDERVGSLLDQVPVLAGPRTVVDLAGGLTNRNLRVTTSTGDYVVRLSQSDAGLLGIDRDAEHANTRAAAEAGVGARVVDYRPDLGMLVITFLPGVALTNETIGKPGVIGRVAAAIRQLQAGPRFVNDFDMFSRQAGYLALVRQHGFPLPDRYDAFEPQWDDVRRVLTADPPVTVPCNNDLLAGNYIDAGDRVWLIDYEYSGNNDPAFELGNTATECDLAPDQVDELVAAWARAEPGPAYETFRARVELQSLCSEYGWSLWGFIQSASSPIDYDFYSWGMERFEKAARRFTSDGFPRLLDEVAG
jgi:thiamine kinase-like enzyme